MDSCFPPLAALSLSQPGEKGERRTEQNDNAGKIEILQDLDLYYIRQIAHNLKEFDLEQKIDLEIKMREGTTKLLAACRHQMQTLEAAKSLLTSNERMSSYLAELQRRRKEVPHRTTAEVSASKARVCLSDLRMPLIWRDTDHFKNKGDYRRFAVFCLARIGTEVYDTTLLCPVDRSLTDLTFPDVLVFNEIQSDFVFQLEVYSHILRDDLSIASTPRKIKKTIHSSISRTVGKKLAASLRDELNTGKIGPHFELMASARLTLDDIHDSIRTHDLKLENTEVRSHQLPLFGHFCCRLAAQPNCISQPVLSGPLTLPHLLRPRPSWAQLQAFTLHFWQDREAWLEAADPLTSIAVDRTTVIRSSKSSQFDLEIVNEVEGKNIVALVRASSLEERDQWLRHLLHHTFDHKRWKGAAEQVMEIQTPGSGRQVFTRPIRQGSLYDETPLIESVQQNDYRPTVQEIFNLTPSTSLSSCSSSSSPTFRERSLSSSGSSKSRSHWPFSRNGND
ncbi:rhotekin-like isoform X2 [Lycorma delicatula]|uniref:rhotekin-like isoform X2 n=1 Tax=Lycorma delicatula TaxID=130591 RepID=UPI003F50F622